jgi:ubiquitin C-terminal hydrolase
MNACLQSIFACPAFFNLLAAISQSGLKLDENSTVSKLCYIQKHFDAKF